ncbi:HD domain-containing protein [Bacillus sp. Marseille-Q1617]|uniref:HD domain-containing protein n=1 Tax=Bacillus sp. Marseille-Q1617 TaxID=2736887 RepID=UPI0020CA9721|nr:HD domain-containing protein [Bacillus sp. Marseille-Q1617]
MDRVEIEELINALKKEFKEEATGHDWFHLERVRNNALLIAEKENVTDTYIIELAALLHDVPDEKLNSSKEEGKRKLERFVSLLSLHEDEKKELYDIIFSISYKGGNEETLSSIKAMIVRDADRLDAMGAIGIARTFAYGGKKGQSLYDPDIAVRSDMTLSEYRTGKSSSIHHFHEKLLKLKDLMCTETGKILAEERHVYMLGFLKQFNREWNGQE